MCEIKGLSLFANVGIAEAMFDEIGVKILLANEIDERRARFYSEVYPDTEMICGDITDDSIRDQIVEQAIEKGVNFIIATPPCQGMSVAGNRDPEDPRNQLISYAIDVIKRVSPDFVKDRNGLKLSENDIKHVIKVLNVFDRTINIREDLDACLDEYGLI